MRSWFFFFFVRHLCGNVSSFLNMLRISSPSKTNSKSGWPIRPPTLAILPNCLFNVNITLSKSCIRYWPIGMCWQKGKEKKKKKTNCKCNNSMANIVVATDMNNEKFETGKSLHRPSIILVVNYLQSHVTHGTRTHTHMHRSKRGQSRTSVFLLHWPPPTIRECTILWMLCALNGTEAVTRHSQRKC